MLSREVMGLACLGVVWVTALLVAAAAWQELRDLHVLARRARTALTGVVAGGDLAEWTVEQTGRALDAGQDQAIGFHDRAARSVVLGGRVRLDTGEEVEVAPGAGEVWVDDAGKREAAACSGETEFDAAYAQARKAKGLRRDVRARVRDGERVWVVPVDATARPVEASLVATLDPGAFCRKKSLGLAIFIPLELAACAVATRLALTLPHFGRTSMAGALACLAFFLGVTPLAVSLREGARRPHEAFLRGRWSRADLARVPAKTTGELLHRSPSD